MIASANSAIFTVHPSAPPRRFAVHGPAVEIDCCVPEVSAEIDRALGAFEVGAWPEGFTSVGGTVRAYDSATVVRHVSPDARLLPRWRDLAELYEDGERFWMVDERWGMAEVNFLKGTWRSWVLPQPQCDAVRVAEAAVMWPLAQLLRPRGLYLLPAAAAVRDGFALLLLCPFGVGPELSALARAGYKIIAQQWTAVREEDGRLALLHVPGRIERGAAPRLRWAGDADESQWVDLNRQFPGSMQHHAFCDAVLVAGAGRRAQSSLTMLEPADALHLLRQAWPIAELHPHRRHSALPAKLSQHCRCAEVQLSRNAGELVELLDGLRCAEPAEVA